MVAMVAMMAICAVPVAIGIAGISQVLSRVPGVVMVMIMYMHAHRTYVCMSMKPQRH